MKFKATCLLQLILWVFGQPAASAQGIRNLFSVEDKQTSFGGLASIPVGNFSSTNLETGGFARRGVGAYFDSKTLFKSGLTFISHSSYSWVPLDQAKLAAVFSQQLARRTTIDGGRHMPFMSTLGLGYDFRASKFLKFGFSVQGGLLYNSFRAFDITVYDVNNTSVLFEDNLTYDSHFSPAYLFGAHVSVGIIPHLLDLQIVADYSSARFNSSLRGDVIKSIKTTQQIQMLNVGAGLVVHVKK